MYEHDSGTALIYEHEGEQQRFDLYLAERQDTLTIEQRLGLIRQLAETLQYAHTRHLYHRALCPKAIYVRNPDTNPQLVITDWQTGGRDSASLNGPASLLAGTSHLDYLVDVTNRSYQAPELVTDPSSTGPAVDVFSLGALGYTIMAGRPPASTQAELQELINRVGGLDLSEVMDVVDGELQFLVYAATFGAVSDRLADVKLFLAKLDEVEHGLLAEAPEAVVDPLDAHRGDILDGLFRVERRLGRGSTAVALLVSRLDDPSADSVVLKVALDHEKDSRLDAEEEALRQLDDWRIVKLLDGPRYVGERRTLVLEYGGEDTLGQRLRHDRLHIDQLQRFGHDLLEIAAHLDTKGTWHRDIKPDNLGIRPNRSDRKPHLVLYDFSMARISATDIHAGTPPYLDPFLGTARSRYDDAAERFAVAVTLYEMAVGTRPIWGDDASNPSAVDVEVAVDSERIDVGVRTPLTEFFQKALARQAKQRHATVEEMARAWKAAFDSVEPARSEGSTPVVGLTLDTVLSETGLTRRALAAAERFGATTVRELLAIPPMELARGQGVNQATKSELTRVAKQWRVVFFGPEADASNEPDVEMVLGRLGIDATLSGLLTETKIRNKIDLRALSLLLGLPDESGAPLEWPDTKQVAALLGTGTSAGQVQRVRLKAVRNTWPESPLLGMVRDDVIKLLDVNGGVMTGGELATALLSAMGSHADEPARSSQALGLVRAVVETELERGGDALLDYARHADVVLVGRERDDPWGLAAAKRLEYGHALGAVAADLAVADPLLPPAGAVRRLRQEPVPDGMDVLDEARLVQLAAAVGGAAVTSTGQIYPRGLDAGRALVLAQAAVGIGQAGITPRQLAERVSARFPEAQPLPDRPELDRVLRDAELPLMWVEDRYKPRDDLVSLLRSATRYSSRLATVPAGSPEAIALQDVDRRIGEALAEGRLLTTDVPARLLDVARQSLIDVFGLREIDVTEFCLRTLHRLADENEIEDWTVVLRADAADRSSTDWTLLLQLVNMALDRLPGELTAAPGPVLLTEAAPLVRYGWLGKLESWITDGTVPRPGVLLVPADDRAATPMLDGKPVPVNSTTQWLTLPTAWLNARNRRAS
nr:serine/threonine protein kinase [Kibdelosporangium sp. MJ126-NF4]